MSVATGANELETATMQAEASAGVQDENIVTVEASEDRLVHFVYVTFQTNILAEVSFSASFELNAAGTNAGEAISSAVLGVVFRAGSNGEHTFDYTSAPPQWDAGEEISLHTNNFASSTRQVRVIIGYEPVGDFDRDRLRNR